MNLSTVEKGDVSESYTIAKIKERGITVLNPVGDNNPYDLVIEHDNEFKKVQVKTGNIKDGGIKFRTDRIHTNGSGHKRKSYDESEVDLFAVYVIETSNLYLVPFDKTNNNHNKLWINNDRGNSRSKYADDFTLTKRLK